MELFEMTEEKLRYYYHRAWVAAGRKHVNPRLYPELDMAISQYAHENKCTYDQALILAKTGRKVWE